jgi:hypothetical protein
MDKEKATAIATKADRLVIAAYLAGQASSGAGADNNTYS